MQNWKELYTELADKLAEAIPAVKWVDLWHNQVNFLETEHPFPTPALFLQFRTAQTTDRGLKVQDVRLQVDVYLYFETFADSYRGSWNQEDALEFLDTLNAVHATLHGSDGDNYSAMRRIGFAPVDTGNAGNLYVTNFECYLVDYAAQPQQTETENNDIELTAEPGSIPPPPVDGSPLYQIPE